MSARIKILRIYCCEDCPALAASNECYENPETNYGLFCKLDEMAMDWIAHCEAAKVEPNPGYSNLLDKKE